MSERISSKSGANPRERGGLAPLLFYNSALDHIPAHILLY